MKTSEIPTLKKNGYYWDLPVVDRRYEKLGWKIKTRYEKCPARRRKHHVGETN